MALYRGTIYKSLGDGGIAWSNTYTISETNALEALDVLNAVELLEKSVHYNTVVFYKSHVINKVNKADARSVTYHDLGELDPTGLGGPLPLFCTVRCSFTDNVKKPEQKYLRCPGNEANLTLGLWDTEFTTYIFENYVTPLLAQAGVVGPSGEPQLSGVVHRDVQNRQLGWHRRTRPGFKRGWVPV